VLLATLQIGRSFLLSLNAFHRLAYRRLSDQRLLGIAEERREMLRRLLLEERERGGGRKLSVPPSSEQPSEGANGEHLAGPAPLAGLGVEGLELSLSGMELRA
jgi:hypothetical protein